MLLEIDVGLTICRRTKRGGGNEGGSGHKRDPDAHLFGGVGTIALILWA
jgi:hypothetical protein